MLTYISKSLLINPVHLTTNHHNSTFTILSNNDEQISQARCKMGKNIINGQKLSKGKLPMTKIEYS